MNAPGTDGKGAAEIRSGVEKALERMRPTLQADGFDLALRDVEPDGAASVTLEAGEGACMECLIPDEMLVSMLEREVQAEEPSVSRVLLHKNFPEA